MFGTVEGQRVTDERSRLLERLDKGGGPVTGGWTEHTSASSSGAFRLPSQQASAVRRQQVAAKHCLQGVFFGGNWRDGSRGVQGRKVKDHIVGWWSRRIRAGFRGRADLLVESLFGKDAGQLGLT